MGLIQFTVDHTASRLSHWAAMGGVGGWGRSGSLAVPCSPTARRGPLGSPAIKHDILLLIYTKHTSVSEFYKFIVIQSRIGGRFMDNGCSVK